MRKWNESAFSVPPQWFMAPMQLWAELFLAEMTFRPAVLAALVKIARPGARGMAFRAMLKWAAASHR
jgi:hypothetical protein